MSALAIDESVKGRQLHKFGGSSLADAKCYLRVANIMANYSEPDDLMVVSAAGSTTNQLINWVKLSQSDRAAAEQARQTLQRYQTTLISDLLPEVQANVLIFQFNDDIQRLAKLLENPLNDVIYAEVTGHGEIWSARLMAQVLQEQGMAAQWLDARTFLCAERAAQPEVDTARSQPLLAELLALHPGKRLVVTGLSPATLPETVLLGRNGSDYSATQVGALAGVKKSPSGVMSRGFTALTRAKSKMPVCCRCCVWMKPVNWHVSPHRYCIPAHYSRCPSVISIYSCAAVTSRNRARQKLSVCWHPAPGRRS